MDISMDLSMDIHIHGNPGNTWQMMRKFPSRKRTKHVEWSYQKTWQSWLNRL